MEEPDMRLSMEEIKKHSWVNGGVYEDDELETQIKLVLEKEC